MAERKIKQTDATGDVGADLGALPQSYWKNELPKRDITLLNSRSSGAGGQHVNKTETNVEVRFHIGKSTCLNEIEKVRVREWFKKNKPSAYIESQDTLAVGNQSERSQKQNRSLAITNLTALITEALKPEAERSQLPPSEAVKAQWRRDKENRSRVKQSRRNNAPKLRWGDES